MEYLITLFEFKLYTTHVIRELSFLILVNKRYVQNENIHVSYQRKILINIQGAILSVDLWEKEKKMILKGLQRRDMADICLYMYFPTLGSYENGKLFFGGHVFY